MFWTERQSPDGHGSFGAHLLTKRQQSNNFGHIVSIVGLQVPQEPSGIIDAAVLATLLEETAGKPVMSSLMLFASLAPSKHTKIHSLR